MRNVAECVSCGKRKQIVGHGVCVTCRRQMERAAAREEELTDPTSAPSRRLQKLLLKNFVGLMFCLLELGVEQSVLLEIRRLLKSYLASIGPILGFAPDSSEADEVNKKTKNLFTQKSGLKAEERDRRAVRKSVAQADESGRDE